MKNKTQERIEEMGENDKGDSIKRFVSQIDKGQKFEMFCDDTKKNEEVVLQLKEIFDFLRLKAVKQTLQEVEEVIDKLERDDWDCEKCGVVNEDTDFCKICSDKKENSSDNRKLEQIKKELELGK